MNVCRLAGRPDPGAEMFKSSMFSKDHFKQMMAATVSCRPNRCNWATPGPVTQNYDMGPLGNLVLDFRLHPSEMGNARENANCARIEFQGTAKSAPGTNANPTGNVHGPFWMGNFRVCPWFDPELGITIDMTRTRT